MNQWFELAKNYGIPGLMLLAFGAFWYFKGWPLLTEKLDDAKAEREAHKAERESLAKRNDEQAKLFAEALRLEREDSARRSEEQARLFMEALRSQSVFATEIAEKSGILKPPE